MNVVIKIQPLHVLVHTLEIQEDGIGILKAVDTIGNYLK